MSAAPPPVENVTITIDGTSITVPKGTLLIRAAEQLGTIVPRFCDHPLLDPLGACRQCMVEVEGFGKPMMACTTTATEGMEVRTHLTSEVARKGQEGTLEFLLINHPLDCPMCDKGGECPLQDQALAHGTNVSRFIDEKRRYAKPVAVSPQILLDRERCVLCARCTRFAEQISGEPFIELYERGALEQVAIFEDEPYLSYFSGNIIQICPVGALTSADYRFKARPFDVVTTPSVCDHCSAGCNLTVQARRGEIQRQLARTNLDVNEAWSCDKGRFGFHHLTAPTRLTTPLVRRGDELVEASWAQALTRVVDAIRDAQREEPGRVAVLTGSRLPDEDAYAASRYVRTVLGSDDLDARTRFAPSGEAAELAALVGRDTASYADVEAAEVIVVAGLDPEEEVPILHLRLRKAWRKGGARIVVVGPHLGSLAALAWRQVPTRPGAEAAALAGLLETGSEVAAALTDAAAPVVLVGERAGPGSVPAAAELAAAVGGRLGYVPRRAGTRGAIEAGAVAGLLPGGRLLTDADDRAAVEAVWGGDLPTEPGRDLQQILADAAAGRIDVLHLIGIDLARDAASQQLARAALARVGTVVCQDLALTETIAEFADVVLPATASQERAGSYTDWEGRTQRFEPAVDAPELAQEDFQILRQLAGMLGHDLGVADLDGLRAEVARLGRRAEPHPLPAPEPAEPPPLPDSALEAVVRPLLLDRGTMLAGADDLLATARPAELLVHPDDAAAAGIGAGELIEVAGAGGQLLVTARLAPDVHRGVVVLPANSTDPPAFALADDEGRVQVTLRPAPGAEGAEEVA